MFVCFVYDMIRWLDHYTPPESWADHHTAATLVADHGGELLFWSPLAIVAAWALLVRWIDLIAAIIFKLCCCNNLCDAPVDYHSFTMTRQYVGD